MTALQILPHELVPTGYRRPRPPSPVVPRDRLLSQAQRRAIRAAAEEAEKEAREKARLEELARMQEENRKRILREQELRMQLACPDPTATQKQKINLKILQLSALYDVPERDVVGPSRKGNSPKARQHLCWWLKESTQWSLCRIGRVLGRDHTTIMHAIKVHQKRIDAGEVEPDAVDRAWWRG
ncbi:hypothetical protein GCM10007276_12100 [Agaricicola taiwanensis]|uniref:Chromosomal replication initiator DnaA C-terminal domain-containing protein n=1 Tax=Agaricicola taiwanensis TaxID=591372 RepID=A0A8J2VP81_9RHOB|nr:helix-turn-helix domain-containing protein [Agaricicola taiwanensis]GGE36205.1 hypothetical protein GCM10007276_12100 [Agaricicola taiwanensis]